jgi:hypothetical protein
MKKILVLLFCISNITFAQTTVKIDSPFRIDPVTGINGDEFEANSKFVQRFIFSPLVLPMVDPYLQDDYDYAWELSLIKTVQFYDSRGNWINYDASTKGAQSGTASNHFRILLRDGLKFRHNAGNAQRVRIDRYDDLQAEDVVLSYRLMRVTADRIYANIARNDPNAKLNSLLYSKLKSFNAVYCKDEGGNTYIYFKMDSNYAGDEFVKLLVYVPILSAKQIKNDAIKTKTSEDNKRLYDERVVFTDSLSLSKYDFYFFNPQSDMAKDFFREPLGYGQYIITSMVMVSSSERGAYSKCILQKNTEWCNFSQGLRAGTGYVSFNQNDYVNDNETITIELNGNKDLGTALQKFGEGRNNPETILYNFPLSAPLLGTLFGEGGTLDANMWDRISTSDLKRSMQISHKLYGLYFGSGMTTDIRNFFKLFSDRVRISNLIMYTREPDVSRDEFEAVLSMTGGRDGGRFILSDIVVKRLYYPFYAGGGRTNTNRNPTNLDIYYGQLEEKDDYYQNYNNTIGSRNVYQYYQSLNDEDQINFYTKFVGGRDFDKSMISTMTAHYNRIQNKLFDPRDKKVKIDICYDRQDQIGKIIATYYRNVLQQFFRNANIDCDIQRVDISNNQWKTKVTANQKLNRLSLLVKGWNYRLDLLGELGDMFVEDNTYKNISAEYSNFASITGTKLNAETIVLNVARHFVNDKNTVMIPLVGVQNYALYHPSHNNASDQIAYSFDKNRGLEILLFPYYWRQNRGR